MTAKHFEKKIWTSLEQCSKPPLIWARVKDTVRRELSLRQKIMMLSFSAILWTFVNHVNRRKDTSRPHNLALGHSPTIPNTLSCCIFPQAASPPKYAKVPFDAWPEWGNRQPDFPTPEICWQVPRCRLHGSWVTTKILCPWIFSRIQKCNRKATVTLECPSTKQPGVKIIC